MPAWKRSPGHPPKIWLKQITADPDTTAVDLLTLTAVQVHQRSVNVYSAADRSTWRAVSTVARLRGSCLLKLHYHGIITPTIPKLGVVNTSPVVL